MSLSCDSGFDGGDCEWYWESNLQYKPLSTKRSRKCCSCGSKISVGEDSIPVHRWHEPRNDIEERIYGDEVPMSKWHLCDTCGGLAISLEELGFCFSLGGQSLKDQIREYRAQEAEYKKETKK